MSEENFILSVSESQSESALLKIAHESLSILAEKYPKRDNVADVNRTMLQESNELVQEMYARLLLAYHLNNKNP